MIRLELDLMNSSRVTNFLKVFQKIVEDSSAISLYMVELRKVIEVQYELLV